MEKIILSILGEEIAEELKNFYEKLEKSNYDYKVHLTQRSYILSKILTEKKEKFNKDSFIASTALMAKSTELARYFMEFGRFPQILICDSYIFFGKDINSFLVRLENAIITKLKEMGDTNEDNFIRTALTVAIKIKVYFKYNEPSNLLSRYQTKVFKEKEENHDTILDIILRISLLIIVKGFSVNNFALYSRVNKAQFKSIKTKEYEKIESYYRGNVQTVYMKIIESRAILTIRTHKHLERCGSNDEEMCYIIPKVFISDISSKGKEEFIKMFLNKICDKNIRETFSDTLNELWPVENEFISMLMDQCLLSIFIKEGGILEEKDFLESEICRIACNFANTEDVYNIVKYIKTHQIFTEEEFFNCIKVITADSEMLNITNTEKISKKSKYQAVDRDIEDFAYKKSLEEYHANRYLNSRNYMPTKMQYLKKSVFSFNELIEEIGRKKISIYNFIDSILQLMDTGMLQLVEYVNEEKESYAQNLVSDHQAITITPLNIGKYMALIVAIERKAEGAGLNVAKEFDRFANENRLPIEESKQVKRFIEQIYVIGTKSSYFSFNTAHFKWRDFEEGITDDQLKRIQRAFDYQNSVKEIVEKYLRPEKFRRP